MGSERVAFLTRQRLPIAAIRIIDPPREARIALAFCVAYIGAAVVTGIIQRAWPHPLWGATSLTSDATYVVGFKIGLLLVVPAIAIRAAGYQWDDLLLGWRATPRALLSLLLAVALGALLNVSHLGGIRASVSTLNAAEAMLRVGAGGLLVLFSAGIPEELVYRWGLQTRLERMWGRVPAIVTTAVLFTAWHLPTRYFPSTGVEGTAGNLASVLMGTGVPVVIVGLLFGLAWDRWRSLPVLIAVHWGIDALPSISSLLAVPMGPR